MSRSVVLVLVLVVLGALPADAAAPRLGAYEDYWPVWSPDGRHLAFTRVHSGNLMELMVVDLETLTVGTIARNRFQLQPSWSPSGTQIAYQAGGDVYVSSLDGAKRRIGPGRSPAFGDRLARVQGQKLLVGTDVWAHGNIGSLAWSPDRTLLAFSRPGAMAVTDGTTERRFHSDYGVGKPVWSPDGTTIAWVSNNRIWIGRLSTGESAPLSDLVYDQGDPSWSPDGSSLLSTNRHGVVMTTLAGESTVLHRAAGPGAAYSPVSGVVAWAAPRPGCPGRASITIDRPVAGTCEIRGTPKGDSIAGTSREGDVILAGAGNDSIYANDGHADRVDCGPGRDTVWADRSDRLARCEVIHR